MTKNKQPPRAPVQKLSASAQSILQHAHQAHISPPVEVFDGQYHFRKLTQAEGMEWGRRAQSSATDKTLQLWLIAKTMVHADGEPIFHPSQTELMKALLLGDIRRAFCASCYWSGIPVDPANHDPAARAAIFPTSTDDADAEDGEGNDPGGEEADG